LLDRIWDLITSGDRTDKLISRAIQMGIVIAIGVLAYNMNFVIMIILFVLGFTLLYVAIYKSIMNKRELKELDEISDKLTEEDDGVTGYFTVRPEELEGAPWEIRKKKPKSAQEE